MPFVSASVGLSTVDAVRCGIHSLGHVWFAVGIAGDGAVQEQHCPAAGTPASAILTGLTKLQVTGADGTRGLGAGHAGR
jgi:hypothetical protein